jgi:cell division protein FtsW (lipid II flippase)
VILLGLVLQGGMLLVADLPGVGGAGSWVAAWGCGVALLGAWIAWFWVMFSWVTANENGENWGEADFSRTARFLVLCVAMFEMFGLVMLSRNSTLILLRQQLGWGIVGLLLGTGVVLSDRGALRRLAPVWLGTALVGVVLAGAGGRAGRQQPDLVIAALVLLVLFLAAYLDWYAGRRRFAVALGLMTVFLLVAGRQASCALVIMATVMAVLAAAGAGWRWLAAAAGMGLGGLVLWLWCEPERGARLMDFYRADPGGDLTWEPVIRMWHGGWDGVGLGRASAGPWPGGHLAGDFVLAVIGEELGLTFAVLTVVGVLLVIGAILRIAWRSDRFGFQAGVGVAAIMGSQAFVHAAVVLHLLPTRTLPFPLVSPAGPNLCAMLVCLGLVLQVDRAGERKKYPGIPHR